MFDLSPQDKAAPGRHDKQEGSEPRKPEVGPDKPHKHHEGPMFDLSPQDKAAPGGHDREEEEPDPTRAD
jgi:hypothetical protein